MGRLLVTALLALSACQPPIYTNFQTGLSDGGPSGTTGVNIGGIGGRDGAVNLDLTLPPTQGLILAHSSASSLVTVALGANGCADTVVSGCTLRVCPTADMAGPVGIVADAGLIQIAGGSQTISLSPQVSGSYLPQSFSTPLWPAGGAELTISASGNNYPGFSSILQAPLTVNVVVPLAMSMLDLIRSGGFTAEWNSGSAGTVEIAVAVGGSTLSCGFVGVDGMGTISPTELLALPAGSGTVTINVFAANTVDDGVILRAETPALDTNGAPYSVPATLH